ncbi:hypothetical protein AAHE18_14G069400 [Arachis hypogaea]
MKLNRCHHPLRPTRRHFATKYTAKITSTSPTGRSLVAEVTPPRPLPSDPRGYLLPRRHLICKATQILLSHYNNHIPNPSRRNPKTPSFSDPFSDLSDYLQSLQPQCPTVLTPLEASEILKSLKSPSLAWKFFHFCPSLSPNFRHESFTYNRLLLILSNSTSPERFDMARDLLRDMDRLGIRGSISTVNILIGFFGTGQDLEMCVGLVKKWDLRLNAYTYKCLLQAYLRSRDSSKGFDVYLEMQRRGYKLDIFGYNMLLDALAKDGKVDKAYEVFEDMKRRHCEPDAFTYTIMIRMTGKSGRLNKLDDIVELSKKYLNKKIYAYFVRTLNKLGHSSEAHRLFCNMWNYHDKGDRDAYMSMVESLCNGGKTTEAIDLLGKIHEKGITTDTMMYNTVFTALGRLKQISHIHDLFEKMKQDGPPPDIFTYNILISSFGRSGEVDIAVKLFEELESSNCKPDVVTYNSLINCLGKNGDVDEAHMRFREMQEKGLNPDVVTYSTLIECFGKTDKVDMARKLFDEMLAVGCYPNLVTYNILLDCLERCGRTAEAVDLYAKLKQQGLTPDSITYAVLERLQSGGHNRLRFRRQNPITGWVVSPLR